jgi:predicted aspartyl protease
MARFELKWDPFEQGDPGPCIDVVVMNSRDVIEAGRAIGLEYQKPLPIRALLDTGASVTVISKKFADYCKLFQTNEGSEITAIGATHRCGEHAGSISFPGTDLRSFDPIRIVSAVFAKERHYACLIGRDILRNWVIVFDGRSKRVTITD